MSRVSNSKVAIPSGTQVVIGANVVNVKGKLGELQVAIIPGVTYHINDNIISASGKDIACVGTAMRLVQNAVSGVNELFEQKLEIHDANAGAKKDGKVLVLDVGFSHEVKVDIPAGISVEIDSSKNRIVTLSIKSMEKKQIGDFADGIKSIKKSRPYGDFCIKTVGKPFYLKKPKGK